MRLNVFIDSLCHLVNPSINTSQASVSLFDFIENDAEYLQVSGDGKRYSLVVNGEVIFSEVEVVARLEGLEYSISLLGEQNTQYIPDAADNITYLMAVTKLEHLLKKAKCDINTNYTKGCLIKCQSYCYTVVKSLERLICMIKALIDLICSQGETGTISNLVVKDALYLFNSMVNDQFIAIQNNGTDITSMYTNQSHQANMFGIKLYDNCNRLYTIGTKVITANNGTNPVTLDKLVEGGQYLEFSINGTIVTYSEGLSDLKDHFCLLKRLLGDV